MITFEKNFKRSERGTSPLPITLGGSYFVSKAPLEHSIFCACMSVSRTQSLLKSSWDRGGVLVRARSSFSCHLTTFEGLGSLGKGDSDVDQKVLGRGHTPCTCSGWGQLASAGVLALLLFGTVARDPQCGW